MSYLVKSLSEIDEVTVELSTMVPVLFDQDATSIRMQLLKICSPALIAINSSMLFVFYTVPAA